MHSLTCPLLRISEGNNQVGVGAAFLSGGLTVESIPRLTLVLKINLLTVVELKALVSCWLSAGNFPRLLRPLRTLLLRLPLHTSSIQQGVSRVSLITAQGLVSSNILSLWLCSVVARGKSQMPLTLEGRGLYKDMKISRQGSDEATLTSHHQCPSIPNIEVETLRVWQCLQDYLCS